MVTEFYRSPGIAAIDPGTLIYTDEYSIYARLCAWGYDHKSVEIMHMLRKGQLEDGVEQGLTEAEQFYAIAA